MLQTQICDSCMEKLKCVLAPPIIEIQRYGTFKCVPEQSTPDFHMKHYAWGRTCFCWSLPNFSSFSVEEDIRTLVSRSWTTVCHRLDFKVFSLWILQVLNKSGTWKHTVLWRTVLWPLILQQQQHKCGIRVGRYFVSKKFQNIEGLGPTCS